MLLNRHHALVVASLAAAFVGLVSLHLHGYSLSSWRGMIGQSEPTELLFGETRSVRMDDFEVDLPLALAQTAHAPAFPVVNTKIGMGLNMLLPFPMPVAHPLVLFRPCTWGFFLGRDVGISWLWWSRHLLVILACFLAVQAVSRAGAYGAALAALSFAFSPFVLFWSMRTTPTPIFGALALAAAVSWAACRRPTGILLAGVALGWSAASFVLTLYPPFQIPLAWFLGCLFLAIMWERRREPVLRGQARWRVLGLSVALGIVTAALIALFREAGDAIEAIRNTAYPGERISLGGERTLWELFATNLWLPLQVEDWMPLKNISEAACFLVLSPPLFLAALSTGADGRRRLGAVEWTLFAALAAAVVHATVGIPEWVARITGLSWVPSNRSVVVLGFADLLLVARLVLTRNIRPVPRRVVWGAALAWAAFLSWCAIELARFLPDVNLAVCIPIAAANGAWVFFALAKHRPHLTLAIAVAGTLAPTAWFNPVVRGGSSYLYENPLSRRILELDRRAGGDSVWIVFGDRRPANLIRVLGVRVINGVHPIPQADLWKHFDPEGRWSHAYNRFAHVEVQPSSGPISFRMLRQNTFELLVPPDAQALRDLGVTHAVVSRASTRIFAQAGWRQVGAIGRFRLFALDQESPATGPPLRSHRRDRGG